MRGKKDSDPDKIRRRWVIFITIFAFLLSVFMSTFSDILLRKSNTAVAFIVLIAIIFIGILFDIIGVAVTVTDEKPFHSMAASKVKGAKSSLMLMPAEFPMSAMTSSAISAALSAEVRRRLSSLRWIFPTSDL